MNSVTSTSDRMPVLCALRTKPLSPSMFLKLEFLEVGYCLGHLGYKRGFLDPLSGSRRLRFENYSDGEACCLGHASPVPTGKSSSRLWPHA